jgi:hypothetical protein
MADTTVDLSKILKLLSNDLKSAAGFASDLEVVALQRDTDKLVKHIHDLRACARSIKIFLQMIEDGERFDSGTNKAMLEQIKRSTQVLQPTIDFLKQIHAAK